MTQLVFILEVSLLSWIATAHSKWLPYPITFSIEQVTNLGRWF